MTSSRTANPYPSIPFPAGAVLVDDWNDTHTPTLFRYFKGSRRIIPNVRASEVVRWAALPLPLTRYESSCRCGVSRSTRIVRIPSVCCAYLA
jgi:hypothetical protein